MLFNLYVCDLQENLPSSAKVYQYADDTTILISSRPSEHQKSAEALDSSMETLSSWSNSSQLALNPDKTKAMLISTSQMSRVHSLDRDRPFISVSQKNLKYCKVSKILGVHFHENLKWHGHVRTLCKSCFCSIRILKKVKNFADHRLCKHLAESLILSKLDYCDTVFYPLPDFLVKRLQQVQFATASFVEGRYVNDVSRIRRIGWLPVKERRDFHLLNLGHKALYSPNWPTYVQLVKVQHKRTLRSSQATR